MNSAPDHNLIKNYEDEMEILQLKMNELKKLEKINNNTEKTRKN